MTTGQVERLQYVVRKLAGWAGHDLSELVDDGLLDPADMDAPAPAPRVSPLPGQVLKTVEHFDSYEAQDGEFETTDLDEAKVITSRVEGSDRHKVVIDLDHPALLLPSTTEGHFHLYVDLEVEWEPYLDLLRALVACGLVESGYVGASESRGFTAVRLPWVKKEPVKRSAPAPAPAAGLDLGPF